MKEAKQYIELAKICRSTYASVIDHKRLQIGGKDLMHQKIVHGAKGRGFCRIFWNKESLVIAFRGSKFRSDWTLSNLKLRPKYLRISDQIKIKVLVHRGFQRTLDYVDKTTKIKAFDSIVKHINNHDLMKNRKIYITGHSLGGALAKIFAVRLYELHKSKTKKRSYKIVSFGAPAVGFKRFKIYFEDKFKSTVRIVNGADIVSFTPPLFYRHVGKEVWLNPISKETNLGWKKRLGYSFNLPLSSFTKDHSIKDYIKILELHMHSKSSE